MIRVRLMIYSLAVLTAAEPSQASALYEKAHASHVLIPQSPQIEALNPQSLHSLIQRAAPGDTVTVPAGIHIGLFVVAKPLTLRGAAGAVLDGEGKGTVLTITGDSVHVSGLTIIGSGMSLDRDESAIRLEGCSGCTLEGMNVVRPLHGIYLANTSNTAVRNNSVNGDSTLAEARRGNGIHLYNSSTILIEGNTVSHTRDGIYFSFSSHNRVTNNRVSRTRYGLHYMYSNDNEFEDNSFTRNAAGGALMFSDRIVLRNNDFSDHIGYRAYGLLLQTARFVQASNNRFTGNLVGLFVDNSSGVAFTGNVVAGNGMGIDLLPSASDNIFVGNTFTDNRTHVRIARGSGRSTWAAAGRGNHWGSQSVFDLDGDGVGEQPFRVGDAFATLAQSRPSLELFSGTPAALALSWAEEAMPAFTLLRVVDSHPLAKPPAGTVIPESVSLVRPLFAAATTLALLLSIVALTGRAPVQHCAVDSRRKRSRYQLPEARVP